MRDITFILIALLIILLCGLASPYYKEGFVEGTLDCSILNEKGCAQYPKSCSLNGKNCQEKKTSN
jgi:hypothetical protein